MSAPLGLSLGTVNLVAVRLGHPPVSRRAVVTLFDQAPPKVGVPAEDPELTGGLAVHGFVQRVGDPVPLAAADGSTHRGEELAAAALEALAHLAGNGAPVGIAVPAHWGPSPLEALRSAVRARPGLTPGGAAPRIVSDAVAAIAALRAEPGLPAHGVVALCDLGGSGTSITLFDAATGYRPVGGTEHYGEFAGDRIDQAVVNHVVARLATAGGDEPAGTAAVGSLARLQDECRAAKERLSAHTVADVAVQLPGFTGDIQLNRTELERVIDAPLTGVVDTVATSMTRNGVAPNDLAAVAIVGGGALIPAVRARLAQRLGVPVLTTPQPNAVAAAGAALLAGADPVPATTAATGADDAPTSMASAAWAAGSAGIAAGESAADGDQSATFRALAWSQDDSKAYEPVPYAGADYSYRSFSPAGAEPETRAEADQVGPVPPLAWYKRPVVLFGLAVAMALAATGGLAYTLSSADERPHRGPEVSTPAPPPAVVTITAPDGSTSVSTLPPSATADTDSQTGTTDAPSTTTTTSEPTTTTTTTTTTTSQQPSTTTTQQPSTTTTQPPSTTTAQPTTQPTTTQHPPTSSTAAPPTTAVRPTTAAPPTTVAPPATTAAPTGGE